MKSSFCIDLQRFMLIPTKFPLTPFDCCQTSVKSEGYIQKKGRHESLAPASQRIMLTNVGFGLKQSLRNRLHGKGQHCDSFKI